MKETTHQRAIATLKKDFDTIERMIPAMAVADEVAEIFPELSPHILALPSTGSTLMTVIVSSMKPMELLARELVNRGFYMKTFKDEPSLGGNGTRRFFFEDKNHLSLQIFAELSGDNADCHFEEVGAVNQPVYELVTK